MLYLTLCDAHRRGALACAADGGGASAGGGAPGAHARWWTGLPEAVKVLRSEGPCSAGPMGPEDKAARPVTAY